MVYKALCLLHIDSPPSVYLLFLPEMAASIPVPSSLLHSFSGTIHKLRTYRSHCSINSRVTFSTVRASNEKKEGKETDSPSFNPFGFVTDNPSSRSAIQLPESPAEDGNVGQMLYRTEDKGKEYGSYKKSGKFRWFVRETGE
ncbi:hypothetical protein SAY86_012128 [Trapa natans]|uniref:Uncharacterized protein n=1 Tax=Trapa natans TaxID=22666 RepID=A0AAN7R6R4_TRANT|nr:hypothetical protein SAY86_012128 [Trapa natans]